MKSLCIVLYEMGNPFPEESTPQIVLDTKDIADLTLTEIGGIHLQMGQRKM